MINGKRAIAIIPARAGSKGLPDKNIRPLCGLPLIGWTIRKALASGMLDEVIVSTDSLGIAQVAADFGAPTPFLRPPELATDEASSYDVIRHALDSFRSAGQEFDYTMLLEPTSPLREDSDIDAVLQQFDSHASHFDSIVTVGETGTHPSIMKRLNGLRVEPFAPQLEHNARRQNLEPAYFPYGVAYAAKTDVLLAQNTFYTSRCMGFALKRYQSFEIDDLHDFLCVEAIMKHEWGVG